MFLFLKVETIIGEDIYYTLYYGFRIVFVNIGPCISLVVLNVLLFRALRRTQQTRERLFAPCHESYYSNSKASLPYNNCLTPIKYNGNGRNNNNGSVNKSSPDETAVMATGAVVNHRKISFEMNCLGTDKTVPGN